MKIVLVTGGFDPLHSGHIAYFNEAKELGDILIVGVNSDEWLTRKKGQPFMSLSERVAIVESLHMVDSVMIFDDSDGVVFGVGGTHKMNSSSKILTEWKTPKTERKWGYYRVLHSDGPSTKVKELIVEPGKSLSLQRHSFRNELWYVTNGTGAIKLNGVLSPLKKGDFVNIYVSDWHQLINDSSEELKIVEIQYGQNCYEEDIERIE